jgi:polyhydroxybutyrate depolymerase
VRSRPVLDILKRISVLALLAACRNASSEARSSVVASPSTGPVASASASVGVGASASATPGASAGELVKARPYRLVGAAGDAPRPLVVLLHGYGSSGKNHDTYFGLSAIARRRGVLLAIPDGTRDHKGLLYWNATEACCDFDGVPLDDVAYLDAVVRDVESKRRVDPARVYAIGHSNGAFMAHVWACEMGSPLAAIVALAGVPWSDASRCKNRGVSVLQVHGDADRVIAFDGGRSFGNGQPYPSAKAAVDAWASRDGCDPKTRSLSPMDLDRAVAGEETTRVAYRCPAGTDVELWRMAGSGHVPRLDARFTEAALDFLLRHHK